MDPTATGLLPLWAELGMAGAIFLAFAMGWVVSGRTLEREQSRADRVEEELRRVNTYVTQELVPNLTRATVALERARERLLPPTRAHPGDTQRTLEGEEWS